MQQQNWVSLKAAVKKKKKDEFHQKNCKITYLENRILLL